MIPVVGMDNTQLLQLLQLTKKRMIKNNKRQNNLLRCLFLQKIGQHLNEELQTKTANRKKKKKGYRPKKRRRLDKTDGDGMTSTNNKELHVSSDDEKELHAYSNHENNLYAPSSTDKELNASSSTDKELYASSSTDKELYASSNDDKELHTSSYDDLVASIFDELPKDDGCIYHGLFNCIICSD